MQNQAAVYVNPNDLTPWDRNPRENDHVVGEVAESIKRFGFGAPILARKEDSVVIAGHTRLKGALLLGLEEVPVRFLDLSKEEAAALALADNKLNEMAVWSANIDDVLRDLDSEGVNLTGLGWDDDELAQILKENAEDLEELDEEEPDYDEIPEDVEALTKDGEVVTLGRHTLTCSDCIDYMKTLEDNSVDAIVTDPPYGIGFMSNDWDCDVPGDAFAAQALRVLKPGGHIIAFAACRTIHRLMTNVEDAGFEIRDLISWLQWQGFPKSLNVSKTIDKHYGLLEHEGKRILDASTGVMTLRPHVKPSEYIPPKPQHEMAKQWSGWGTALKPSQEPAVLARKPLEGTVADNVLKWGTGGINVDACRIPFGDDAFPCGMTRPELEGKQNKATAKRSTRTVGLNGTTTDFYHESGRWPANVYHCKKPSRSEREEGCDDLPTVSGASAVKRKAGSKGLENPRAGAGRTAETVKNTHPTVKPIGLMSWLVRLVTPEGGTVLEPFCGSGTTLLAAELEGVTCLAVEREPKYCDIIRARFGGLNEE